VRRSPWRSPTRGRKPSSRRAFSMEGTRRGPYGGAVGYFGFDGSMDTCITIRTIVKKGDTVYLQGGAGIVADSRPEREYEESMKKMEALAQAVEMAEAGI